jgi:hypothetical protein
MRAGGRANDDLFRQANDSKVSLRRARTTGSNTNRTVEWEDEDRMTDDRSLVSGLNARHNDSTGPSTRPHLSSDPSRASPLLLAERDSRGGRNVLSRPATSMAEFYHDGKDGNTGRGMTLGETDNIQEDRPRTVHFLFSKHQPRVLHQKGHVAAH